MKIPPALRKAAEAEASKFGGFLTFVEGGKHPKMIIHFGTFTKKMPFGNNPRHGKHQIDWFKQNIRRAAAELR